MGTSQMNGMGNCRGVTFSTNFRYIKQKKGIKSVSDVEAEMAARERPLTMGNVKDTGWYPLKTRFIFLEVIRDTLGWDEEKIFEMGQEAPAASSVMSYYLRDLKSIELALENSPMYWKKHYDVGYLQPEDISDGSGKLRLGNFPSTPLMCKYLCGYYRGVALLTGAGSVEVTETKCACNDGDEHLFEIVWK